MVIGEEIEVIIDSIDFERQRISLRLDSNNYKHDRPYANNLNQAYEGSYHTGKDKMEYKKGNKRKISDNYA